MKYPSLAAVSDTEHCKEDVRKSVVGATGFTVENKYLTKQL